MGKSVPPELGQFIARHIENIGHLEVLLFLYRAPQPFWNVAQVTQELRGNPHSIAQWLNLLTAHGLAICEEDRYRFQAASSELSQQVGELGKLYQARPSAVIELIHSHARSPSSDLVPASDSRKGP